MPADDEIYDREPDPRPWGIGIELVGAPFELFPDGKLVLAGDPRSVVVDLDHQVDTLALRDDPHEATPVTEGVDNEVVDCLLDAIPIDMANQVHLHARLEGPILAPERLGRVVDKLRDGNIAFLENLRLFRQQQQIGHDARHV